MRAEDVIEFMRALDDSAGPDDLLADVMLREGIAYDELARFLCLGGFRVENALADGCDVDEDGAPLDEEQRALFLHGRLWLDGFLVGRRMRTAELDAMIDAKLREVAEAVSRSIVESARRRSPGDRPSS